MVQAKGRSGEGCRLLTPSPPAPEVRRWGVGLWWRFCGHFHQLGVQRSTYTTSQRGARPSPPLSLAHLFYHQTQFLQPLSGGASARSGRRAGRGAPAGRAGPGRRAAPLGRRASPPSLGPCSRKDEAASGFVPRGPRFYADCCPAEGPRAGALTSAQRAPARPPPAPPPGRRPGPAGGDGKRRAGVTPSRGAAFRAAGGRDSGGHERALAARPARRAAGPRHPPRPPPPAHRHPATCLRQGALPGDGAEGEGAAPAGGRRPAGLREAVPEGRARAAAVGAPRGAPPSRAAVSGARLLTE